MRKSSKPRRRGPRYAKRKTVTVRESQHASNAATIDHAAPTSKAALSMARGTRPTAPSIQPSGTLPPATQPQGSDSVGGWLGGYQIGNGEDNTDLIGENLFRTFAKLLSQTISIAAAVRYSLNLIRGIEWSSSPNPRAPSSAVAQKAADLVRDGLLEADMPEPWSERAAKQSLFAWYGFAMHNWIWRKRGDGTLVYADLQHRPQYTIRRWDIREEGMPWVGVEQHTRAGGAYYIARSRLWYTADKLLTDQPGGVGLLRHVVEHARRLERYEMLEGYAFDANLRGIPIGRAPLLELDKYARTHVKNQKPSDFVDEQTAELRAFLTNHIKTPEQGMLLDSAVYKSPEQSGGAPSSIPQWAIDLLQGDDMGLADIARTIERLNREILRVMGCEWMLMGDNGSGSRAMHTDKTAQYGAFLNGIRNALAHSARNDLVRPLVAANMGAQAAEDACPLIVAEPISKESLREATGAVLDMVNGGSFVPPDDPIWNQLRRRGGFVAQQKIPPELRGGIVRIPRDPNDPTNPDNGGDGNPQPRRAAGGSDADQDPDDLRQSDTDDEDTVEEKPAKRRKLAARRRAA